MQCSFRLRHFAGVLRGRMPRRSSVAAQLQAFANHVCLAQPLHQGTKVSGQPDSLQQSRQHSLDNDAEPAK